MTTKTDPLEMAMEILNLAHHDFDLCREYVAKHVQYRPTVHLDFIFIRRHNMEVMLLRNGQHSVAPVLSEPRKPLTIEYLTTVLTEY